MGTVWLARMSGKLGFERMVALKTILPTYSSDRQFCDMFLDEAKIAAQIDHENVARILEIGEDRGLLYYAMELIDGESLRKLYRDVRAQNMHFPMGVALRIIADACAGLHATHELHGEDGRPLEVVHRDVSPQNLLVSIRGTTKLIDFGVAKANARRSEATEAGTLKGKIEYMAPEQASGRPLDRRADVYALGAVLYELLAGRPVYDTDQGKQLAALHELMTGAAPAPLPSNVPHLVRNVVERAIARDPAQRYATAEELRRAIEQAILATGQGATTEDVANVLAHFSRERTAKRRDAIERAVQAARAVTDGRLNAATIVAPLSSRGMPAQHEAPGSAPGVSGSAPGVSGSAPGGGPHSYGGYPPGSSAHVYAAGQPYSGHSPAVPPPPHSQSYVSMSAAPLSGAHDGSQTGPSMRTIGAASMSAHPRPGSPATKILAAIAVLGLVALLGVGAGIFVTRRNQTGGAAGPTAPTANTTSTSGSGVGASASTPVPIDPVPPVTDPAHPALVPSTPSTGVVGDETAATAKGVKDGKDAGATSAKRPSTWKPPGKAGTKPGDGDEYGF